MRAALYLASTVVSLLLGAIQLLMFVRALLSWFPIDEENPILQFVTAATEPFIIPVRALLERVEFIASSPIDISFFVTFILLSVLQTIL